jgi:CubicO group peptidase (beta-lactamase class C family)
MSLPRDFTAIDALLERACEQRAVPGVVAVVADSDHIAFERAYGSANIEQGVALPSDAIFRIASLTKAVVAIAVLQLVERGQLELDTPVGDIIPAFDGVQVLEGFDGDTPRLRAPHRRATVRNLMTHTSGLTYDAFQEDLLRYGAVTGVPMPSSGLKASFASPMVIDPSERFTYGMSTDWTGQVLEALTGQPLDEIVRERVTDPLGLDDVAFTLSDEQTSRLAPVHMRQPDGAFQVIDFEWPSDPEFHSAGHGLYATAGDYVAVQQLLLRGGELRGVRLLEPGTVATMTGDELSKLGIRMERLRSARPEFSYDLVPKPNVSWGLDTEITTADAPGLRPAGSFGWCGTFNNFYWIDPTNGIAAGLHMSYLPLFDPAAMDLYEQFERAVYAAL